MSETISTDTLLACLLAIARLMGVPSDEKQIKRAYSISDNGLSVTSFPEVAAGLGIKVKKIQASGDNLLSLPKPCMAKLINENYIVILKQTIKNVVIYDPYKLNPITLPIEKFVRIWTGEIILTKKTQLEGDAKYSLSWLVNYVYPYRRIFVTILFLSLLLQCLGLISPLFMQVIIDKVLVHRSLSTLDVFISGMAGVTLFQGWITLTRSWHFNYAASKIDLTLSNIVFKHILSLPLLSLNKWQVGDIVARVKELDTVRQFLVGSAFTVILDIVFAGIYMAAVFSYSTKLAVLVTCILPLYVLLNFVISPLYRLYLNRQFLTASENHSYLVETIMGIQTVKCLAVEAWFVERWENLLANSINKTFSVVKLNNIAVNAGNLIEQSCFVLILWFGAKEAMTDNLSIGGLIAVQMLASQVFAPVLRLTNIWQNFQQVLVSVERLGELLNEKPESRIKPNRITLPSLCGDIVFDKVSFSYNSKTSDVLKQINLHIKPGECVGFAGHSGSGKSTLAKLVQGLYWPNQGRVIVDGVDLTQVEPAWLRRNVGVVLQHCTLFNGTIRENILAFRKDLREKDMLEAAQNAGIHEFIRTLPKAYDTVVGERGVFLSGGQRQRLAIARALVGKPSILIFDEATSSLDALTEQAITNNLKLLAMERTVLVISHRLSTLKFCNRIYVIDEGQITEKGSHDELLALKGVYYKLFGRQSRGRGMH